MAAKNEKAPCRVCGNMESDRAHIRSRGAGGSWDSHNIIRLCRDHHREQHSLGWPRFLDRYPMVAMELKAKGWVVEDKGYGVRRLVRA